MANEPEQVKPETKVESQVQNFDVKAIGDEDFVKVFEDPRIWKHERFKELNESAKAGKEALRKLQEIEENKMKEQGQFQELASKEKQRAEEAMNLLKQERINNRLMAEATKAGATDLEAVLKLVDQSLIVVNEDGSISGVDVAVSSLLENKPYLKQGKPSTIGTPSSPVSGFGGVKKFTLSQIQDPVFYRENKEEIAAAYKSGAIIDDTSTGN